MDPGRTIAPGADDGLAQLLADAAGLVVRSAGRGLAPRAAARAGRIELVDLGVPQPWSVRAYVPWDAARCVTDGSVSDALVWCATRAQDRGFTVSVSEQRAAALEGVGLAVRDAHPVFAMPAGSAAAAAGAGPVPHGLDIGPPRDLDEIVAAYGGWMDDLPLAEALIRPQDYAEPSRRFLVGRAGGRPVGCALVWLGAGTAYLSGIGVAAADRGRGYGRALTAAAAALGAKGGPGPRPEVVWMHATNEGAGLYRRMGFRQVDTHLLLGPA